MHCSQQTIDFLQLLRNASYFSALLYVIDFSKNAHLHQRLTYCVNGRK